MRHRELAYAKLNLVLQVGRSRDDGLHPLCSLFASIDLADEVHAQTAEHGADTVECPGVEGDNLVLAAVQRFRERTHSDLPVLAITIDKQIPVAAGLGGGSADAAAALRMANRIAGLPLDSDGLRELAAELGSDVPSQVEPRHALVEGVGERVTPIELPPLHAVLIPDPEGLSTAEVYAEHDRLDLGRRQLEPERLAQLAGKAAVDELIASVHNDLQPAVLSLRPDLEPRLGRLTDAGAEAVAITGSGPTCFGLFRHRTAAEEAAAALGDAVVTAFRGP